MHRIYFKVIPVFLFIIALFPAKTVQAALHNPARAYADTIKGIVRDSYGMPLPGAQVVVKESGQVALAGTDGRFSVFASQGNTLHVRHSKYYNFTHKLSGRSSPDIQLSERFIYPAADTINILNGRQSVSRLLQSTATVYTNQLTTSPSPTFLIGLQGRLAGANILQSSGLLGRDGSGIFFSLRGQSPLILIDGVPRGFSSLDPEEVESITVLKDALSTVLLGQRASNGVVLVTTKKGQPGPPKISFTAQTASQSLLKLPQTLSSFDYATLYNEALQNDGQAPVYTQPMLDAYKNGTDPVNYPDVDWYNTILNKTAPASRYNLNMEGGGSTAKYFVSLDYLNQNGYFKTSDINSYNTNAQADRYLIRSNVNVDLSKNFNFALNLFGRVQNGNQPGVGTQSVFSSLLRTPNNAYPVLNPDGSLTGTQSYTNNIYGQAVRSGYLSDFSRDLAADLEMTRKLNNLAEGLWAKGKVSFNTSTVQTIFRNKSFAVFKYLPGPPPAYQKFGTDGDQVNGFSVGTSIKYTYTELSLGYDKQFGEHSFNALLLANQQIENSGSQLPANYSTAGTRISYALHNKYFAEAAMSYSGFNRYKPGKRAGFFPAVGLGWDISKESFVSGNLNWINALKLRTSYGRTGNADIGYYVYNQYFADATAYTIGATPGSAGGVEELVLANPNGTWEKADKFNMGIDASLFSNHLSLTAEYFNNKYFDLMQQRGRNSTILGNDYPSENIGINRYTGTETLLTYQNSLRGVNYFVSGNVSSIKSEILYQDEVIRQYEWMRRTGRPTGLTFGYISNGFFQSQADINASPKVEGYVPVPGDLKYRDLNGDNIINQFDQAPIGSEKPLLYYGATLGFNYRGFDFNMLLQGVANRTRLALGDSEVEFQNNGNYQAFEHHLNRWTPANAANANYPRLSVGVNINNQVPSSFFIRSADYMRLKNAEIGYTFPKRLASKLRLSSLRLFANGLNLFTSAEYDRLDPEYFGASIPVQRVVNAGINIKL
ncbi:SusC/RagA family TonB-linked outer membrane protein [Daejeonella sp.]|uniref:SusC/RagA family TonB-linked outer membrane protein n=1 Tax=Daejeonella sp. TaxID=2805397 RepID=UPI0030BF72EB